MRLLAWEALPEELQVEEVRPYYDSLSRKRGGLLVKRGFDILMSLLLLIFLSWAFAIIAIAIKLDSPGPVFFRQERVTQYGRRFRIFKFRTMVVAQAGSASLVTVDDDPRVTRVGRFLRGYRLDEISQLLDVLRGTMSFVGPRPEVPRYVERYLPWMRASLLLPAGVTSSASIRLKDEARILSRFDDTDRAYVEEVLPVKMRINVEDLAFFSLSRDLSVLLGTVIAVLGIGPDRPEALASRDGDG